jgi:hypothetical protein
VARELTSLAEGLSMAHQHQQQQQQSDQAPGSLADPVSLLKQARQHTRNSSVDAEAVMAALEENGFHATGGWGHNGDGGAAGDELLSWLWRAVHALCAGVSFASMQVRALVYTCIPDKSGVPAAAAVALLSMCVTCCLQPPYRCLHGSLLLHAPQPDRHR